MDLAPRQPMMSDHSSQRSEPLSTEDALDTDAPTVRRVSSESTLDDDGLSGRDEAASTSFDASGATDPADVESAPTVIRKSGQPLPPPPSEQATPAEVAKVLEGAELGNFRLERLIGGGGMGAVFRAADTRLNRTVAIKVIPRVGEDLDLLRRFKNEAQSAAKLDHPNIARVYDVGQENGWHYIVFEHIDGVNLRDLVSQQGVLSIDDSVYYTRQVAEALEHASERGVVHRDIKPSNVLVTSSGQVKLVDMGLARSQHMEVTDDMTASGVTLGTFDYISPEQARDPREADVRSDLYSLGCTLYFMLVGRPPFPGGSILQKLMNHGNTVPPNLQTIRSEVGPDLSAIVSKMLAKKPSDRYQRPIDLIADLHHLATQLGLTRSASLGTVTVPPSNAWPKVLQQHLPWMVAVSLLLFSAGWVQLLGSSQSELPIPSPEDLALRQPKALAISPPSSEVEREAADVTPAPGVIEEVAVPPPGAGIQLRNDSNALSGILDDPPPVPWSSVIVDPSGTLLDAPTVASLDEALVKAQEDKSIETIELRSDLIEIDQLTVPRSGLKIRAAEGFDGVIVLQNTSLPSMQRVVKVATGGHSVAFEGIHFFWNATNTRDGGAVFELSGNVIQKVELVDCSLTIDNLSSRPDIHAFYIPQGASDSSVSFDNGTSANGSLVWLKWKNCMFRGQMTLIGMQSASRLDVEWSNGLLATTGRFLETGGAEKPSFAMEQIKMKLDHVTSRCDQGFAKIVISPESPHLVVLNRSCNSCTFVSDVEASQVEVVGLDDVSVMAPKCLLMQGKNNAYDLDESRMGVIYSASGAGKEVLEYRWTDLNRETSWFTGFEEERPKSTVIWSDHDNTSEKPVHTQRASDYLQDGVLPPGCDPDMIPEPPDSTLGN